MESRSEPKNVNSHLCVKALGLQQLLQLVDLPCDVRRLTQNKTDDAIMHESRRQLPSAYSIQLRFAFARSLSCIRRAALALKRAGTADETYVTPPPPIMTPLGLGWLRELVVIAATSTRKHYQKMLETAGP
jgi:hypothetical protein